jgi:hypothetical protein
MTNRDNIQRLVERITADLAVVKSTAALVEKHVEDVSILNDLASSAIAELSVFTDTVHTADESAQVKPLHDRVHVLVVQLRVLRNTLEQMENSAEKAHRQTSAASPPPSKSLPLTTTPSDLSH